MKSVYSAVWTGSLNKAACASSLQVELCVITHNTDTAFISNYWVIITFSMFFLQFSACFISLASKNKPKPEKESCYVVCYRTSGANKFKKLERFFPPIRVNLMKILPWLPNTANAIKKGVRICHVICTCRIESDSKRWTQFLTSIFPELYMICECSTLHLKEKVLCF